MQRFLPFLLLAVVVASCSQNEPSSSTTDSGTSIPTTDLAGSVATPPVPDVAEPPPTVASRVECPGELMTTSFDYVEGAAGADSIETAVDGWTFEGGAPYLRSDLRSIVDDRNRLTNLVDESGTVRIVLSLRDYGNGWLVETSER